MAGGVSYSTTPIAGGTGGVTTVEAGTYTPTTSGAVNIASINTTPSCSYLRVANNVFVWCAGQFTKTAAASATTTINLTLPIARSVSGNFTGFLDCRGGGGEGGSGAGAAYVLGIAGSQTCQIGWSAEVTSSRYLGVSFAYEL
jgi:hypothetical protein